MRVELWTCAWIGWAAFGGIASVYAERVPQATAAAAKPDGVRAEVLRTAQERLQTGDEPAIRSALASLGELGGEQSARLVAARLRRGLPPQLIEAAVDTLVLLNRPSAGPALLELTQHRRMQVRVKAMQALAALAIRSAQSALLYALDDPNTEVRTAAVNALASVGNGRALPALFAAADRGVPGAWEAIGQLAGPADFEQIFARAYKADVGLVRPALDGLMRRTNLPPEAKLRAVQLVQDLGSPSARAWLVELSAALPADTSPRMREGLAKAIKRFDRAQPSIKVSKQPTPGRQLAQSVTP